MTLAEQLQVNGVGSEDIVRLAIHDVLRASWPILKVSEIPEEYLNHSCEYREDADTYILHVYWGST